MDEDPKEDRMTPYETDLVEKHLYVARHAAHKRYATAVHALEETDLRSMAYFGLVQAAKRWLPYCARRRAKGLPGDPGRLDFFAVYASRRCDGAIMDELRQRDYATRSTRGKSKRLREAGQDEGRTITELAAATGMKVSEVSEVMNKMQNRPVSLEAEGSDVEIEQTTESQATVRDILLATSRAVSELPEDQQVVLALHYYQTRESADEKKMLNLQLQQVAAALKIPDSEVTRLHKAGVLSVHSAMLEAAEGLGVSRW